MTFFTATPGKGDGRIMEFRLTSEHAMDPQYRLCYSPDGDFKTYNNLDMPMLKLDWTEVLRFIFEPIRHAVLTVLEKLPGGAFITVTPEMFQVLSSVQKWDEALTADVLEVFESMYRKSGHRWLAPC